MDEMPSIDRGAGGVWEAPRSFLEMAEGLGVAFDEGDLERFGRYLALLYEANERFNLTAVRDYEEAWTRHVGDSLTLLPMLSGLEDGAEVVDVGSGGGAPGLVLAIALPGLRFTLVEATGKKARFLGECAAALGLTNVRVIAERAEVIGQDHRGHRGRYDAATARAVGPLAVVAELVIPLLKVGGVALLIKGQRAEDELREAGRALEILRAECASVEPTPTGRIVCLEKVAPTPRDYPRRSGEPKRAPLGAAPERDR